MTARAWTVLPLLAVMLLAGCGGGTPPAPGPAPPADTVAGTVQVGPLLLRPASTSGFVTRALYPGDGDCSFAAVWGAEIEYMESVALLDRIVFTSIRDGYQDIWLSDLDGSNLVQLTNNTATDAMPEWSPDGRRITFARRWPAEDSEVMVMDADGTDITALTDNTSSDEQPTFSPDGRRIAFQTNRDAAQWEIYCMYADGSSPANLTSHGGSDTFPNWCWATDEITWVTSRDGNAEVYYMDSDGQNVRRVTDNSVSDGLPSWRSDGQRIIFDHDPAAWELYITTPSGMTQIPFSNSPGWDQAACYATSDRHVAFTSNRTGNYDTFLQETDPPYTAYQVTDHAAADIYPDLGSPTMQTERVLIGPPGSDWGGLDPVWSSAYAGVCAFDADGYRNFVRIGIPPAALSGMSVSPMPDTGWALAGVLVDGQVANLREDAGRGREPIVWELGSMDVGAAILYFQTHTGKLQSVLAVREHAYPTAAASDRPWRQTVSDGRLVVEGDFAAVFDAAGHSLAPQGATCVCLGADGAPEDVH